jgi:preprotein translocase subunit SecB
MKPAPISLVEYFVTDLSLAANRNYVEAKGLEVKPGEFATDVNVTRVDAGERKWQLVLEVKHQAAPETNFPYAFRAAVVGFFTVAPRVAADEEERTVKIQGASVLYGVAREIVRAMTGRGPHRPILIPTASFYERKPPEDVVLQ